MHRTEPELLKARKVHICTSCGQRIEVGDTYKRWRSYDDGDAGTSKMHPECYEVHDDDAKQLGDGRWEYTPFSHERPMVDSAT